MSVRVGQARLKRLAKKIANNTPLDDTERDFLSSALAAIASGEDAETALQVKAKRGERKSQAMADIKLSRDLALGWIAAAIQPESQDGLGLSVKEAAEKIKMHFSNLPSEDSLKRIWSDYKRKGGGPVFKL